MKEIKTIAIYGARMVAMSVYHAVKSLYKDCRVTAFLVTEAKGNLSSIDGIPVIPLENFEQKDICILIAAQDNYQDEIAASLEQKGMRNYIWRSIIVKLNIFLFCILCEKEKRGRIRQSTAPDFTGTGRFTAIMNIRTGCIRSRRERR